MKPCLFSINVSNGMSSSEANVVIIFSGNKNVAIRIPNARTPETIFIAALFKQKRATTKVITITIR